jgi:hypothetical protein
MHTYEIKRSEDGRWMVECGSWTHGIFYPRFDLFHEDPVVLMRSLAKSIADGLTESQPITIPVEVAALLGNPCEDCPLKLAT